MPALLFAQMGRYLRPIDGTTILLRGVESSPALPGGSQDGGLVRSLTLLRGLRGRDAGRALGRGVALAAHPGYSGLRHTFWIEERRPEL